MLLKLFFESLQFSVGECGVVIAKDILQLALSLVSAPVVVVSNKFSQVAERSGEDKLMVIEMFHRGTVWVVGS